MRPCSFVGLALILAAATACRQAADRPEPASLRVLVGGGPATLDPHIPFDDVSSAVLGNLFETLVHFDRDMRLTAGLARRWINPDETTWRFFLDPEARFPDGSPLRAEDVSFSIERLRSLPDSDLYPFASHVAGVEVVDGSTVDVRTDRPVAILNYLAFIPIVSRAHVTAAPDEVASHPFGTGPYILETWVPGRRLTLRANPHHRPVAPIPAVDFEIREGPAYLTELEASRPDIALFPGQHALEVLAREVPDGLRLVTADGLYVFYVGFNMRPRLPGPGAANPLAQRDVRRALAALTPRGAIVDTATRGFATVALQLVVPPVFGYDPSIATLPPPDTEAALRTLHALPEGTAPIELLVAEQGSQAVERLLAERWNAAGLPTRLVVAPLAAIQERLEEGRFGAYVQGWGCTSGDSGELLDYLLHTRDPESGYGLGNVFGFSDPELDRISEGHLGVFDPRRRLEMLQRAQRIVHDEVPVLPLYAAQDVYVVSDGVEWTPRVDGEFRLEEVRLTSAAGR